MDLFTAILVTVLVVLMATGIMMELDHRQWMTRLHELEVKLHAGTLTDDEWDEFEKMLGHG